MSSEDTRKTPDTNVIPPQVKGFVTHLDINDIKVEFNVLITFNY